MKTRFFGTAVVGLIGAIIGSFSMMLYASTHFTNVAGPNNTPPALSAAPLTTSGSDQDRIVAAVKHVEPSVVSLLVTVNGTRLVPLDPFSQMFGGGGPSVRQRVQERASGSGFVYTKSGLIITNAHVVPRGVSQITVVFGNGDRVPGHLYSSNPAIDLALVKVDGYAKLPPPVEFADSTKLSAGQWAIAIGEPFELKQSVSLGVVSGFNRDEPIADETGNARLFRGMMQTSAPINPGNSGGPLIDIEGRLIGVNQSTATPQAGAQGIGFAIPSNMVRQTVAELEQSQGKTLNADSTGTGVGYIGVQLQALDNNVRAQLNYPQSAGTGVVIAAIPRGGPASKVDLTPGDVIQKINDHDVKSSEDVIGVVKATKIGQSVRLQVWSGGTKKLVIVPVAEQPANLFLQQQQQQQQQQFQTPEQPSQ
jgi:S1-C subfamily serine protease